MKILRFTILLAFLSSVYHSYSQDLQVVNDLYFFDRASYNTAYIIEEAPAPVRFSLTSSLGGGVQETKRFHLLAYGNIPKLELGIGLKVNTAFYGLFNYTTVESMYAKDFSIDRDNMISVGMNFGLSYIGIDRSELNEYVQIEDPFLLDNNFPELRFTAGTAIAYRLKDKFHAGFSIPSLIKNNNNFRFSFIGNAAYTFVLNDVFDLEPELVLYGTRDPNLTLELNSTLTYYDIFSFKLGYRSNRSLLFGFRWNRSVVKVGYIYQLNMGKFQPINTGIHNINVSYVLD